MPENTDFRFICSFKQLFHRDGTIEKLEERLKRLEKEANTHEEPEIC